MRQKLLITCGLWAGALAFPLSALALGLGKTFRPIRSRQPLSAQIELSSAQKDELDSLRARVADPSVYRENNAQYVGALARARVTVESGPNNTPFNIYSVNHQRAGHQRAASRSHRRSQRGDGASGAQLHLPCSTRPARSTHKPSNRRRPSVRRRPRQQPRSDASSRAAAAPATDSGHEWQGRRQC